MFNDTWQSWLFRFVKGALIGTGAILPGVSGGVLCVVMGIYKPMMALLARPFQKLKSEWRFFLPVVLGGACGVIMLSRLLDALFRASETPVIWLFTGLICGTLPSLYAESGRDGRGKGAYTALTLGFALALGALLTLKLSGGAEVKPNTLMWFACGALWAVGLIVPGMSPSAIFIFLGLYAPMNAGIAYLDFGVLLPMGAGLALTVALLARGMQWLLSHYYACAMHAVLGITIASTLMIIPLDAPADGLSILLYAVCFALGLAAALGMCALNKRLEAAGRK